MFVNGGRWQRAEAECNSEYSESSESTTDGSDIGLYTGSWDGVGRPAQATGRDIDGTRSYLYMAIKGRLHLSRDPALGGYKCGVFLLILGWEGIREFKKKGS